MLLVVFRRSSGSRANTLAPMPDSAVLETFAQILVAYVEEENTEMALRAHMPRLPHPQRLGQPFRLVGRRVGAPAGIGLLLAAAVALLAPGIASAHAHYGSSNPAPNAILTTAPTTITVHFMENVNPQGSDLVVYDAKGNKVSTAPGQVDRNDLKTMTVSMQGNGSEIYMVEWHTVSADDGDPDIGAFNFLVNPSAATKQTVLPKTTTTTSSSSGMPIWLGVVLGVIGLVVGGGGGYFLAQRSSIGTGAPASSRPRTS